MTKTISGGPGEPGEQAGDVETGEPGHVDVEEDHVDAALAVLGPASRAAPMSRRASVAQVAPFGRADPGVGAQQVEEFFQGGGFVVDRQYAQHGAGV